MKKLLTLTILYCLCLMACHEENDYNSTENLVDFCWKYANENPNGFTLNIKNRNPLKEGIVVAYTATQNCFGKEGMKRAIEHAKSHCNILGGWKNKENEQYYFDSDTIFQETMLKEAIEWGRKNGQIGLFIISENKVVKIE